MRDMDNGITGLGPQPGGFKAPRLDYDKKKMELSIRIFTITDGKGSFEPIDITADFKAAIDIQNMATCWYIWIAEKGSIPIIRDIKPLGESYGPRPSDHVNRITERVTRWKRAFGTFFTFMSDHDALKSFGIVELLSPEPTLWNAMNRLVKAFQESAPDYPDQVPVVIVNSMTKGLSGPEFVFEIVDWIPRPDSLPDMAWFHENEDEEGGKVGKSGNGKADDIEDTVPF